MAGIERRAWPAHAVAVAGAWLAALVAGKHVLASMPQGESLIIGLSMALLAALIRTSQIERLLRWGVVLASFVAAVALAGYLYLDWRGAVPFYELVLPTLPVWAAFALLDRALASRGW